MQKILTQHIALSNQNDINLYESRGGYKIARTALSMSVSEIQNEVRESGLRGRGGNGILTAKKWNLIDKNSEKPIYLIMNANEGEPGTFKDRLLLENDPHLCLEGLIIAAKALNVHFAIIYIRGEYTKGASIVQKAIRQCYERGYLGDKIFKTKYSLDIVLHRGAGAYICGEETALINSIEGERGQPRLKPPLIADCGLYGMPTVVNNVETLANLPWIIEYGGAKFAKIGTRNSTGTKLISVSGHVNNPGVYEVEMGYPILEFLENECGGIKNNRKLKAVFFGGPSLPVLRANELYELNIDYESMEKAGTMLGTAGMLVLDEDTKMAEICANLQYFYAMQSCGQCTPCREGAHWVEKLVRRISNGTGAKRDFEIVQDICKNIMHQTTCPFGDSLVAPIMSCAKKIPEEFGSEAFKKVVTRAT